MDYRVIDFLNNFECEDRSRIIDFGKQISSSELKADVYIVMARKAICFVDALIDFNLAALNGIIVSDRVLDMDISWFIDKSIVIIDDALVSGTTIRKAIDKLKSICVKSIKVCVLSINDKWYNNDVLIDTHDYLVKPLKRLEDYKCMHMCYTIVKALSTIPKPYDIDFPLFEEILISESELNRILNNDWITYNVTSDSFISNISDRRKKGKKYVENDFESLTLMPNKSLINDFCDYYGIMIGENCILKMRTYLRRSTKDKSRQFVSFLPFVIFNDIELSKIDELCSKFIGGSEHENCFNQNFFTYSSKLRFLQYIISYHLAFSFFDKIFISVDNKYELHRKMFSKLSMRRVKYIFPDETANLVISVLMESFKHNVVYLNNKFSVNIDLENFTTDIDVSNIVGIYEKLSESFLYLYKNKEIKARELTKLKGKNVIEDMEYQTIMGRLETGYTFGDLKSLINGVKHSSQFVSLFLDYAIDTGIAVPIICLKGNRICRAYRHGEDVIFAEKEAEQLTYMLYIFQLYAERENINMILLEKLLTTFIRIGLSENIFEKYDYKNISSDVHDYIKIIYYLHGPTVRVINKYDMPPRSYIWENETYNWLANVLVSKRMLIKTNNGYCVNKEIAQILKQKHEVLVSGVNAKNIAKTIAYFYKNKMLTEVDLIKLNSSYGEEQIIPALAAEICIIRKEFFMYERQIMKIKDTANLEIVLQSLLDIRNSNLFKAMNNAFMKMDSYINKIPEKKIKDILNNRNNDLENEHFYDFWIKYWNSQIMDISKEPLEEVSRIISVFMAYLCQYNLITRKIELMILEKISIFDTTQMYISEIKARITNLNRQQTIAEIKVFHDNPNNNAIKLFEKMSKLVINSNSIKDCQKMDELLEGKRFKEDINRYFYLLKYIMRGDNILNSQVILQEIIEENFMIDNYLEHLKWINERIGESILSANNYINNRGEIEKPICYDNVISIKMLNKLNADNFVKEIVKIIGEKKKGMAKNTFIGLEHQSYNDDSIMIFAYGEKTDRAVFNLAMEINNELNKEHFIQIDVFLKLRKVIAPFSFTKSTESINTTNFQEWYLNIKDSCEKEDYNLCVINDCSVVIDDIIMKAIEKKNFNLKKFSNISHEYITERSFNMYYLTGTAGELNIKKGKIFGIITAKTVETDAVLEVLEKNFNVKHDEFFEKHENDKLVFQFQLFKDNRVHKIYIIQQLRQGNVSTAIAFDMLQRYKPDTVIFVGIAGSLSNKIAIGDVIIPYEILDTTLKKESNDEISIRGTIFKIKSRILNYIEYLKRNHSTDNFKIFIESMLSDNIVIATDDSILLKKVFTFNDKVAGVEMESAGLYDADYQRQKQNLGVLSIRGVSDNANSVKNDDAHALAAKNAAIALYEFISIIIEKT